MVLSMATAPFSAKRMISVRMVVFVQSVAFVSSETISPSVIPRSLSAHLSQSTFMMLHSASEILSVFLLPRMILSPTYLSRPMTYGNVICHIEKTVCDAKTACTTTTVLFIYIIQDFPQKVKRVTSVLCRTKWRFSRLVFVQHDGYGTYRKKNT